MAKSFFKKIIVAINGSQSSIHAAMYAIMMARTYNILIKFVYVVDTATIKYLSINHFLTSDEKSDFKTNLQSDGENFLNYVENLARSKGVKPEREIRNGGVFTEIIKSADEFEADLILLGGNESNLLKRNILSKDQSEVLSNAKCPVMIIQKPDIEKMFKTF